MDRKKIIWSTFYVKHCGQNQNAQKDDEQVEIVESTYDKSNSELWFQLFKFRFEHFRDFEITRRPRPMP